MRRSGASVSFDHLVRPPERRGRKRKGRWLRRSSFDDELDAAVVACLASSPLRRLVERLSPSALFSDQLNVTDQVVSGPIEAYFLLVFGQMSIDVLDDGGC